MMDFDDEEIPNEDIMKKNLALDIKVNVIVRLTNRTLIYMGSNVSIYSIEFLQKNSLILS